MYRLQMMALAVVVGVAIFFGVAVTLALVVFSVKSSRDIVHLDSQVRELTSVVAFCKQSPREATPSWELSPEPLNLTLEENSSSMERRLEILTGSMDEKFDSLNSSFTTSLQAVFSNQIGLASRQDVLERFSVLLKSCQEYRNNGHLTSGVYTLNLGDVGGPFPVYCDMRSDGYGWAVFQRRLDGSEDFYRIWADYKAGFGRLGGEFWLGNDKLHRLTSAGLTRLRVDLGDWQNNTVYALYSSLSVAGEEDNYRFIVSGYNGTAGNSLSQNNGSQFTTKDKNNGPKSNCASAHSGAWWYASYTYRGDGYFDCTRVNLNGLYNTTVLSDVHDAVYWFDWKTTVNYYYYPLKSVEMKLR